MGRWRVYGLAMTTPKQPRWIDYWPLDDVKVADWNPKDHEADLIAASIAAHGFVGGVIIDERTGKLVAGHGRRDELLRARAAGEDPPEGIQVVDGTWMVPVQRGWRSKTKRQAEQFIVADNATTAAAGFDAAALGPRLEDWAERGELDQGGYTPAAAADLFAGLAGDQPEPDEPPTPPVKTKVITRLGDVWQLGQHRLVCGDSFDPTVQDLALDGRAPTVIFTDPPYGMDLETDFSKVHGNGGGKYEKVIGDDAPFDASPIIGRFSHVAEQWWWGADYYRDTLDPGGSWVVWDKRGIDGEGVFDKVHGNHFELCWSRQPHRREIARIVWAGTIGMPQEDTATRVHPNQKPTALVRWFFKRWVAEGALVFDPFGGSGSVLAACEQTDRACATIELSPAYCDVIVRRWQALNDGTPLRNGKPRRLA